MPVSVTMPRLGESVTEGTITRWLKQEGDRVEADEPLLEVSTDKVDTEIPSPAAGVLSRIVVHEDETAEVGSELAVIDGGEDGGNGARPAGQHAAPEAPEEEPASQAGPPQERATVEEERPAPPKDEPSTEKPVDAEAPAEGHGTVVTMPALGESVTEGTVTRWLKSVGDTVEADEPLLEVSTDKVDTEIPSPISGVIEEILVQEDETVDVGTALVRIGDGSGAGAGGAAAPLPEQEANTTAQATESVAEEQATPQPAPTQEAPAAPAPA